MDNKHIREARKQYSKQVEGLKLLVEGLIEHNLDLAKVNDRDVNVMLCSQSDEVEKYLDMAKNRFFASEEELALLNERYKSMNKQIGYIK